MKNLKLTTFEELTELECEQIEGGSAVPKGSFWRDVAYVGSTVIGDFLTYVAQVSKDASLR